MAFSISGFRMEAADYDVVIIGGGSSGLLTAREASSLGCRAIVLEEHDEIGIPERCAGLFSISGLSMLNIPISNYYVQNIVRGAVFKSPGGRVFELDAKRDVAVVSSRSRFDKYLEWLARQRGSEVSVGTKALSITEDGLPCVRTGDSTISARLVVDAEGYPGLLARKVWRGYRPRGWVPIIQAVVEGHGLSKDFVYLYFKHYLKDFFGYMIPIDEELGKVGVAARRNTLQLFCRFLEEEFGRAKVLSRTSAAIYLGRPLRLLGKENILAVGDVAGHVKATTGGGVIFGGLCAIQAGRLAGRLIAEGCGREDYERSMRRIYAQLNAIYRLRYLMPRVPPSFYDAAFKAASDSGLAGWLAERGDMDIQGETFRSLLSSRQALRLAIRLALQAMRDLFL